MVEHLSDENIDAILSSIKKEVPAPYKIGKERKVNNYDFKKALRFSQDQIRTLTRIHENFARLLTSYFSTQLRTYVQLTVTGVEQYSYEEFIQNIQKNSLLGVFEASPLPGSMIMEFSPDVAYVMFDRLLGGQGNALNKTSDLTEIETSVIERVFVKSLDCFQEAWTSVIRLWPALKEIEVNPQFLTMSPPNETVIMVTLQTKIGEVEGVINLCLPHLVLEKVLPNLSARHWLANQKKVKENHEVTALEKKLQNTKLNVKAVLGQSSINIEDFLNLNNGDVIRLQESITDPVKLLVDDKQKFFAQAGVSKGRLAVQITEVQTQGENSDGNW